MFPLEIARGDDLLGLASDAPSSLFGATVVAFDLTPKRMTAVLRADDRSVVADFDVQCLGAK